MPWDNTAFINAQSIAGKLWSVGMRKVIISPGSRNAPISLAFKRTGRFEIIISGDERTAGFLALGIRDISGEPVGVITTSGSAVANLFPAVTEAFFREKEVIFITADRPESEAGNWTGQTIFQSGIFGKHVVGESIFDLSAKEFLADDLLQEIGQIWGMGGPYHINLHIEEPFYPEPGFNNDQDWQFAQKPKNPIVNQGKPLADLPSNSQPILILGQSESEFIGSEVLRTIVENDLALVYHDICSNEPFLDGMIGNPDLWSSFEDLPLPSIIISSGMSILSKKLRTYLANLGLTQYHIGQEKRPGNPFNSKQEIADGSNLLKALKKNNSQVDFVEPWKKKYTENLNRITGILNQEKDFTEGFAANKILSSLPANSVVHLGNSMPVRYASFYMAQLPAGLRVFSNRGTSGIDGCISTSIGAALGDPETPHFLLIGDQSFFYDSNAFWINRLPENLGIIILNNHGGGIFEMIEGPSAQPEFDELFFNPTQRNARTIAEEPGLKYSLARSQEELSTIRKEIEQGFSGLSIFELETNRINNLDLYTRLKEPTNG